MSDVKIPEDVMQASLGHLATALMAAEPGGVVSSVDVIARAILAERERCAKPKPSGLPMSKGENMVERVEQVIANGVADRLSLNAISREVIEALVEPTSEMRTAGTFPYQEHRHGDLMNSRRAVAEIYRAMLRTALSQPNDEGEGK
jgi:hypothetical protein